MLTVGRFIQDNNNTNVIPYIYDLPTTFPSQHKSGFPRTLIPRRVVARRRFDRRAKFLVSARYGERNRGLSSIL